MFHYYFKLGLHSLRRNPVLTALMVLTLAIGVAASISTLTILHMMSGNPIPEKSERLFVPSIDNGPMDRYTAGQMPDDDQVSYRDAMNLLAAGHGLHRTAVYGVNDAIEPTRADLGVIEVDGAATTSEFFSMFDVPFLYGSDWSPVEDKNAANVIVLSRKTSEKLFGNENPVGRHVRIFSDDFHVVGVLGAWSPAPRYTRLINGNGGNFAGEDDFFIPFNTAIRHQKENSGGTSCQGNPGPGFQGRLDSECTWIQFWFEESSSSDRSKLQDYLDAYTREQKKFNRFPRQNINRVYNVMEWMDHLHVVSNDGRLSTWLSFGFLALCLVNTVGLLLAKFSVRAGEVGVRRALGASRAEIFKQFLIESAVVGLVGGVLGLVFSAAALYLIARQSEGFAVLAHMDWLMLALTFVLAILASVLAGLLPTWRACQVMPALQLKSQ
ncbi:MAG TPA: ABC transporter permease [Burkholderiaceae bacterium]|jgi:putative ABC transport system permease protein|nr:ABC transporter permease [Burkholderiaceae bacterium]